MSGLGLASLIKHIRSLSHKEEYSAELQRLKSLLAVELAVEMEEFAQATVRVGACA